MINIKIRTQPNDVTCGPTSLHSIYQYYGDNISLADVIKQVSYIETGGTFAALLGRHALDRGYQATIYTYNLHVFDPSWFHEGHADSHMLRRKLKAQLKYKTGKKFRDVTYAYLKFLKAGGRIKFKDLTSNLLKKYFEINTPILSGLSATYLYQTKREYTVENQSIFHDLKGGSCGHFVVLCGYDEAKRHVIVADPHRKNPISFDNYYKVSINTLINAILLGVITNDANLLIITPQGS